MPAAKIVFTVHKYLYISFILLNQLFNIYMLTINRVLLFLYFGNCARKVFQDVV